ncbi:chymotrypsin-2 isoform X2 [Eurytemora carolleeae]|nr:chymotrypsin-2 isoform X2 [Eurytemora carolleeae]XP_023345534.1 chymotrypsin-2 isoform X2 [Eurytemora carolleeae]XP_023345541.1 chymotrypsin-2 isoform X2 [Eurytemora carolleeae]|eukprot:XP_023345529.1 chymotrypsin-2-like isoform X2 [Eurytemora affinis]
MCQTLSIYSQKSVLPPKCGLSVGSNFNKIVGGVDAVPGEFPWMVMVKIEKGVCGGTIISRKHILSAAHCFVDKDNHEMRHPTDVLIYVERFQRTFGGKAEKVTKIIIRKDYNVETSENDIAVLELVNPLVFTKTLGPICLPDTSFILQPGEQVLATGWGQEKYEENLSKNLKKVNLNIFALKRCVEKYKGFSEKIIGPGNICTLNKDGRDACLGDSGGPMSILKNGQFLQVGITSWGYKCAEPDYPGVWTNLPHFIPWIEDVLQYTEDGRNCSCKVADSTEPDIQRVGSTAGSTFITTSYAYNFQCIIIGFILFSFYIH